MEERLRIVDAYLAEFEARPVDSSVKPQPLFTVGRRLRRAATLPHPLSESPKARRALCGL